jgi:hypothetical protein
VPVFDALGNAKAFDPTLPLILKIARALKCSSAHLMTLTEAKLAESAPSAD